MILLEFIYYIYIIISISRAPPTILLNHGNSSTATAWPASCGLTMFWVQRLTTLIQLQWVHEPRSSFWSFSPIILASSLYYSPLIVPSIFIYQASPIVPVGLKTRYLSSFLLVFIPQFIPRRSCHLIHQASPIVPTGFTCQTSHNALASFIHEASLVVPASFIHHFISCRSFHFYTLVISCRSCHFIDQLHVFVNPLLCPHIKKFMLQITKEGCWRTSL